MSPYVVMVPSSGGITHKCSTYGLSSNRIERLDLIRELSDSGMSNNDTAYYLNDRNLKTSNGKTYCGNLIWASVQKYNKRISRFQKADEIARIREWALRMKRSLNLMINWDMLKKPSVTVANG